MKSAINLDENPNPWYREPWPWILMAGPFLAIIGCLVTIYLAFTKNIDVEVRVEAYQQGKFVSRDGRDMPQVLPPRASTKNKTEQ